MRGRAGLTGVSPRAILSPDLLAARLGVEPRQNESESFVLPLHHQAVGFLAKMEPAVGVEPTTLGLQNRCSATELSRPFYQGPLSWIVK
jgi:hypothetical protein